MSALIAAAKFLAPALIAKIVDGICEDLERFIKAKRINKTFKFAFRIPFSKNALKEFSFKVKKTGATVTFSGGDISIPIKLPLTGLSKACRVAVNDALGD